MSPKDYKRVHDQMQEIANSVKAQLPEGFGFVVFVFPFGTSEEDEPRMNYVSNARREDVIATLREWIAKTSRGYAKDLD